MEIIVGLVLVALLLAASAWLGGVTEDCLEFVIGTFIVHHTVHVSYFVSWVVTALFGAVVVPFDIIVSIIKAAV